MPSPTTIEQASAAVMQATDASPVEMQRALAIWEHCSPTPLIGGGWRMSVAPNQPLLQVELTPFYACSACTTQGRLCAHALAVLLIEYLRKDPMEPTDTSLLDELTPAMPPTLVARMEAWEAQQHLLDHFVQKHFEEGNDFHIMKGKPSLGKAGAEKLNTLFELRASFVEDLATQQMLAPEGGVVCYLCTLHSKDGTVFAEGRGARALKKDGADHNKTVKMCQKSAQIDATIRGLSLSAKFTQDLEDSPEAPAPVSATVPQMSSGPIPAPRPAPAPPKASPEFGPQASFVATELRKDDYNGRVSWKVFGEGIPARFAKYGISLSPQVAQESEVDLDESTDIEGWRVEWATREYQGKTYANVTKLVDPDAAPADDSDDIPF